MRNSGLTEKINLLCLLAAIAVIMVLPLRKEIWYDETVSILCAKGISHDAPVLFRGDSVVSSAAISNLNTLPRVFYATVNDNANSFLYNAGLHWFTGLAGNSIGAYMLFSKLIAVGCLIAFFLLCPFFFGKSLYTSLALALLVTDIDFTWMSHEIRAYQLGVLFVLLSAIYFYRYMYKQERPFYLFLAAFFAAAAFLSHFLSIYIIVILLGALVWRKKSALLKPVNILALFIPVALVAVFFFFAYPGLQTMSHQNEAIQQRTMTEGFSLGEVFIRSIKFTDINLKVLLPAFWGNWLVVLLSLLVAAGLYAAGLRSADKTQRGQINLLLLLGAGNTLFLALLCIKSHHYTALYYRYFSFCVPFCCLYAAYVVQLMFASRNMVRLLPAGALAVILLPALLLFMVGIRNSRPVVKYNHTAVARQIANRKIMRVSVPEWRDAFLINSLLPAGYKIDYFRDTAAVNFVLYNKGVAETIPVIRIDE